MYDVKSSLFIIEPPKCMSRTVEEIVKRAAGEWGKDTHVPGHLCEDWVLEHEHTFTLEQGLPPITGLVMVMREPVPRAASTLAWTRTDRDGDILATIDRMCDKHGGYRKAYTSQTEYLSLTPVHIPKYFFTLETLDRFAEFMGYEGELPHNNPTPKSYKSKRDRELAEFIVAARYADDVTMYEHVTANGGTLVVPGQGYLNY